MFKINKNNIIKILSSSVNYIKNIKYKNIKFNFLFSIVLTLSLLAPDYILKMFGATLVTFEGAFTLRFFALCLMFTFCRSRMFFLLFVITLFILENIQLNNMAYFKAPITVGAISNIFRERKDIFDIKYIKEVWFVFPTLLICYGFAIFSFFKFSKRLKTNIVILLILPFLLRHSRISYFYQKSDNYFNTNPISHSIYNTNKTFSYFFFRYLRENTEELKIDFKPYKLTENEINNTRNIFLIMGESTANKHMSLYGYERETTPNLERIKKESENFEFTQGLSVSICTGTTFALFFNTIREPGNFEEIEKKKTANLFKIAKEQGFKTYYISAQESALLNNMDVQYIDEIITKDNKSLIFSLYKDEGLVKILEKLDLENGKNFIVLGMRSPHAPYDKRYKGREDEFEKYKVPKNASDKEYRINTYDNAILYTDHIFGEIIDTIKIKSSKPYYIFLTSDHGQLFGEPNGLFGHNHLVVESAKVPFIVISSEKLSPLPELISHYQIGKMIIKYIGYDLINENEKDNINYIHDINIKGNYKFLEYKIDGKNIKEIGISNLRDYYGIPYK